MILCFDLLKYVADLEQLELGMASTVVRLIDLASAQLINSDAKEREQQQYNQVRSGDADHQVQVCEKQDLAELIGLAFSWLRTLSRYPLGRHQIQYTNILDSLALVSDQCIPLIRKISESHSESIIEYAAGFLKAYTTNRSVAEDGPHQGSTIDKIAKLNLYAGFICEQLLFSRSIELFYLGLSIVKNIGLKAPYETGKLIAEIEETCLDNSNPQISPLDKIMQALQQ